MDWDDAIQEAKEELGVYGYVSRERWDEVVESAKDILRTERQVEYDNIRVDLQAQAQNEHQYYLTTPHWKRIRESALIRDEYTCRDCGIAAEEVHHLSYERKYKPEEIDDVVSLCIPCHNKRHGIPTPK
jgi:hypothetical protein